MLISLIKVILIIITVGGILLSAIFHLAKYNKVTDPYLTSKEKKESIKHIERKIKASMGTAAAAFLLLVVIVANF